MLTLPALARAAHWASASHGASTYGTPINRRSRLHSSLCSFVTRTVLRLNLSTSSVVPISFASSMAVFASSLFAKRFANYPASTSGTTCVWDLAVFEKRWGSVKDVAWLNPIINDSESPIEHSHQMTIISIYTAWCCRRDLVVSPVSDMSCWPSCDRTAIIN